MIFLKKIVNINEVLLLLKKFNNAFIIPLEIRVGNLSNYANKLLKNGEIWSLYNDTENIGFIAFYMNDYEYFTAYLSLIAVQI